MLQALCLVGVGSQDGHIKSVVANRLGNGVELVIRGDGVPKPKSFPFLNGKLRVLEFEADMDGSGGRTNVGYGAVQSYFTFWYSSKPAKVRINVRLARPMEPVIAQNADGWTVVFPTDAQAAPQLEVKKEQALPKATTSTKVMAIHPRAPKIDEFPDKVPPLETYTPANVQDRITIDFSNTDIVQVLKAVALQSGVNIVSSGDVKGTVTVALRNVTVDEALRVITSLSGLAYTKVSAAYVVAPKDKIDTIVRQIRGDAEPPPNTQPSVNSVTRSYLVRGGLASELVKAVGGEKGAIGGVTMLATPAGSVSRQTVVLTGPDREVATIMETLQLLDSADASTAVFQIYDVKYLDPRAARDSVLAAVPGLRVTLAPNPAGNPRVYTPNETLAQANQQTAAGAGGTGPGAAGGGNELGAQTAASSTGVQVGTGGVKTEGQLSLPFDSFEPVSYPMRLVLRGTPEQLAEAKTYLATTDIAPRQVALELRAMELSKEEAYRVGLDWSILSGSGLVRLFRVNQGFGGNLDQQGQAGASFKGGSVVGTLDQLSDARHLIARPNLLALDGREAEVFVGDVIRYVKSIQSTQNGTTVLIDEVRVGVRMSVLARAGADGNISLDLRPTVSFLRSFTDVPGGGVIPQTSERTTQNTAVMKSGDTIALGGLIQESDRNEVRGIPILKDLPIVGQLFRRNSKDKIRTETVFFLTAKVVDPADAGNAAQPKPESTPKTKN